MRPSREGRAWGKKGKKGLCSVTGQRAPCHRDSGAKASQPGAETGTTSD